MVLYYAMGGGLGHLVRASAFLSCMGIDRYRIITASPYADKIFRPASLVIIPPEFESHMELLTHYIQDIINRTHPGTFMTDSFSHGILGELNGIQWGDTEQIYITRHVKWKKYRSRAIVPVRFQRSYILEELTPEHYRFLQESSDELLEYSLKYPEHPVDPAHRLAVSSGKEKWFVIHSGPVTEVKTLLSYAETTAHSEGLDPEFFVISQVKPGHEEVYWTDLCPVHGYFPYATKLVTACGFNIMNQTLPFRDRHLFVPFPRKYDDQFLRADRAKNH